MNNIANISDKIVDNLYTDAKQLLEDTKLYLENEAKLIRGQLTSEARLEFTLTISLIVTMQAYSMSWIMGYKAFRDEEMSVEELLERYTIPEIPEIEYSNIKSFDKYIQRTVNIFNLTNRHIKNIKGDF